VSFFLIVCPFDQFATGLAREGHLTLHGAWGSVSANKGAVTTALAAAARDRDYNEANYFNYSYRDGRGIQRGNRYLCGNAQRSIANQGSMSVTFA
jgi:hypothetical protein